MNWQRLTLNHAMQLEIRNMSVGSNIIMNNSLLYLLNDGRGANRYPYIEHGLNLEVEITRMYATAKQFHSHRQTDCLTAPTVFRPHTEIKPSFWLYKDPQQLTPRVPIIFSRTWVHPGTATSADEWHWLSIFQVFNIDDHDSVKRLYERREWFPYKDTQMK